MRQAVAWLGRAFGFAERVRVGEGHRARLAVGAGALITAEAGGGWTPPRPGAVTHAVLVRVDDAVAHFARTKAHGARIVMEPTDFAYGERQYAAAVPAAHHWTFSETLADMAPDEWGGTSVGAGR